jgi:hypothetical protein
MERCKKLIKEMRKRAKDLREDTLVSMHEGIANEIMARELEEWANKLEAVASDSGQS